jgi:hypothetical protein
MVESVFCDKWVLKHQNNDILYKYRKLEEYYGTIVPLKQLVKFMKTKLSSPAQ